MLFLHYENSIAVPDQIMTFPNLSSSVDYEALEEKSIIMKILSLPCCFLQYVNKTCKQPRIRLGDEDKTEVGTAYIIIIAAERSCH